MKKLLSLLGLLLVAGAGALAWSFAPAKLDLGTAPQFELPAAQPPAGMRIAVLHAGKMLSKAGFAWRGGNLAEDRVFGMAGILVQHPAGNLLFDAGFGSRVDAQFKTTSLLMQTLSKYEKERTVAEQLSAAGVDAASLKGVVLTHAHWDHVSGLDDLRGVPVWVTQKELDFIRSGHEGASVAKSLGELNYRVYDFKDGPYLGFERSFDMFGDGSVVIVPTPGHTPGSNITFITMPDGVRYALVGDLVWQREGIELPAERPWMSSRLVDLDRAQVRKWIVHMHHLSKQIPGLVIVPAHDRRVLETLPGLGADRS